MLFNSLLTRPSHTFPSHLDDSLPATSVAKSDNLNVGVSVTQEQNQKRLATSFWSVRYVYALLLWFNLLGRFFVGRLFGRVAELRPRYKPLDFRSENDDPARHFHRG